VCTYAHTLTHVHSRACACAHIHTHKQVHMHHAMTGIQTRGLSVGAAEVSLLDIHNILFRNVMFLPQIYAVV
jgi:hypothetical protein